MSSNWILTFNGGSFSFDDIEGNEYDIRDISHSLALTCRYGGMTAFHYSVAQHSCLIADEIFRETRDCSLAMDALMHDAEEAYMGDMKTPLKNLMPEFRAMSARVDTMIRSTFAGSGVPSEMQPLTKEYDMRILLDEKAALLTQSGPKWDIEIQGVKPLGVSIERWTPMMAEARFLQLFDFYSRTWKLKEQ